MCGRRAARRCGASKSEEDVRGCGAYKHSWTEHDPPGEGGRTRTWGQFLDGEGRTIEKWRTRMKGRGTSPRFLGREGRTIEKQGSKTSLRGPGWGTKGRDSPTRNATYPDEVSGVYAHPPRVMSIRPSRWTRGDISSLRNHRPDTCRRGSSTEVRHREGCLPPPLRALEKTPSCGGDTVGGAADGLLAAQPPIEG